MVDTPGVDLAEVWACPTCHGRLEVQASSAATEYLECPSCAVRYPVCTVGARAIPWLFVDPHGAAADWQARYQGFVQWNHSVQDRLQQALCERGLTVLNRERLERQLHARHAQAQQVAELLEPLGFDEEAEVATQSQANLGSSVAQNQGLLSYHSNLFRDWAWGTEENQAQLAALEATYPTGVASNLGRLVVLGAGAGRLAFDLHQSGRTESTTLLDCNPLLLIVASHMFAGAQLDLYEFPVAPCNSLSHAVLQHCRNPQVTAVPTTRPSATLNFVFADATKAPFADASFDSLLTPWLLDILPCDLADFLPQVNRLLPMGGEWLNTGSVAFQHGNQRWCYSEEECLELVEQQGFQILQVERQAIPYLQSPHSSHRRTERVLSFRAKKIAGASVRSESSYLPDWALHPRKPLAPSALITQEAARHLLTAQVLAAVDGQRSLEEIGQLVAKKYGLSNLAAATAVRQILLAIE